MFFGASDWLLVGSSFSYQFDYSEIDVVKMVKKEKSADFTTFYSVSSLQTVNKVEAVKGDVVEVRPRFSLVDLPLRFPVGPVFFFLLTLFTPSRAELPGGGDELVKAQMSLKASET